MDRNTWLHHWYEALNVPHTRANARAGIAWLQTEGSPALWNPLATTQHMPGSWQMNEADVQNYPDFQTGLEATMKTILGSGHGYERIIKRLRANAHPYRTCRAIDRSDWGTQKLIFAVLADIVLRGKYWDYATKRVAGS